VALSMDRWDTPPPSPLTPGMAAHWATGSGKYSLPKLYTTNALGEQIQGPHITGAFDGGKTRLRPKPRVSVAALNEHAGNGELLHRHMANRAQVPAKESIVRHIYLRVTGDEVESKGMAEDEDDSEDDEEL
jgi:hypothetical protein